MPHSKLWHDDIRRPPDASWFWARTNREAVSYLLASDCTEASLDHDLGLHEAADHPHAIYGRGEREVQRGGHAAARRAAHAAAVGRVDRSPEGDGRDLVQAMVALRIAPPKVTIHSWNPTGAEYMAAMLRSVGVDVAIAPYQVAHA